jgi:hypothetical protein
MVALALKGASGIPNPDVNPPNSLREQSKDPDLRLR